MPRTRRRQKRRNQKRNRRTRKMMGGNAPYPHFSERLKEGPEEVNDVPLTIYQSYGTLSIPPKMRACVDKLRNANPEFKHYLYSDTECLEFIEKNFDKEVADAFNLLKPGAYKSDLWRYCILYKLGGVYIDIKFYTSEGISLKDIIKKTPEVFVLDVEDSSKSCASKVSLYNAFMISPPNNNIFKKCIDSIVACCKEKCYKESFLSITGPCLLGEVVTADVADDKLEEYKSSQIFKLAPLANGQSSVEMNKMAVLREYDGYRDELNATQKNKHYGTLWNEKDVYN